MLRRSQDDIALCSTKKDSNGFLLSKIDVHASAMENNNKIGSMPCLNSYSVDKFSTEFQDNFYETKQEQVKKEILDLKANELFVIANEVHSKFSSKVPLVGSITLKENKQYHSWPKQYGKRKLISNITSYHNFGITPQISKVKSKVLASKEIASTNVNKRDKHATNNTLTNDTKVCKLKQALSDGSNLDFNNEKNEDFNTINNQLDTTDTFSSSSFEDSDDWDSGLGQFSDFHPLLYSSNGVAPPLFKKRKDLVLQWFRDFSDEQKNIFIQNIMDACGLPQMHLLSLKMEPILHEDCPENCKDMLHWLPESVVYHILSYLDPTSLSKAGRVNRTWRSHTSQDHLWQRFCRYPKYRLSAVRHHEQIQKYKCGNGKIQWRRIFVERYCCRKNWMSGKCRVKTLYGHTAGVSCVQFDNKRIVSGSSDKTIRVWDLHSPFNEPVMTLVGHSGTVRCLQLSDDRLISGSADATIKVWDLSVGLDWSMAACRVTMVGHSDIVRCLQVDEHKVISGSYDMTIKVWELKNGRCRLTLRGHIAAVLCVQFDEEKIVSGSADNTIKVWNISDGVCLATLCGHHNAVTCLQFNHTKIISGSLDCTLRFWDLNSGQCIGTIDWIRSEGHTRVVRCLQADNWKIVSAGDDKTLKIWSLKTGQRFVTLHKHTDGVTCLQFDDVMIVSGSYDKTVKVWNFLP